jgi:hypothetical protein
LNPEKCTFLVHLNIILGLSDLKKILTIVHMLTSKAPKDIQVFNHMAQYHRCFIKDFDFIMAPITKLLWKIEAFEWTTECQ